MGFKKNKIKETRKMSYIILITLILFVFILSGCSFIGKNKANNEESINNDYTSALIEKNNNIYIFDEDEMYLEGIGDLTRFKEFAALSNDWRNVAFKYMDEKNKIIIYSMDTEEYRTLEVEDIGNDQISNISWMDNNIIVELYVNPTTTRYLIYGLEKFEILNTCQGILIDVLDNGKTLVYGVNKQGITSIFINEAKIYTLETKGEVLLRGKVSPDKKEIGFITFNYDREKGEQSEYLYTGKINDKELQGISQVIKPYEITGNIVYQGKRLLLAGNDGVYIVEDNKFIKDDSELNEKLINNSLTLKGLLKNTFKDENIRENLSWQELGIYNITWFTR
ncbi:hypothetical protein [Clostridium sp.]|uniref:hypothetical protein n=1 Tax=Clostridium sp. TaxID=1506 RepID=UPI0032167BB3